MLYFPLDRVFIKKIMKSLLKKLGLSTAKSGNRVSRNNRAERLARQVTSAQIARMGQFGQKLVVMSK